jgi:hypothetical protein
MKSDKTKLHHHRKTRKPSSAAHVAHPDAAGFSELDIMLYRLERSPKQENL